MWLVFFSCKNSLWPGFWELLSRTGLCLLFLNTPGIEQVYMNFQLGVFCISKRLYVWVLNPHKVEAWTLSLPQGYYFLFCREKLVSLWFALNFSSPPCMAVIVLGESWLIATVSISTFLSCLHLFIPPLISASIDHCVSSLSLTWKWRIFLTHEILPCVVELLFYSWKAYQ